MDVTEEQARALVVATYPGMVETLGEDRTYRLVARVAREAYRLDRMGGDAETFKLVAAIMFDSGPEVKAMEELANATFKGLVSEDPREVMSNSMLRILTMICHRGDVNAETAGAIAMLALAMLVVEPS